MNTIGIRPELKEKVQDVEYTTFVDTVEAMAHRQREILKGAHTSVGSSKIISIPGMGAQFVNKVIGPFDEDFTDQLPNIEAWFRDLLDYCAISIYPSSDSASTINQIVELGYRLGSHMQYWVMDLEGRSFPTHDQVIPVTNDLAEEFVRLGPIGFNVVKETPLFVPMTALFETMSEMDGASNYLFRSDDRYVGTGSYFNVGDCAFLANGSVLSEYRGQRIQQHLANHRLAEAISDGAKYAMVTTGLDTTSGRNMQRIGFQLAFTAQNFVKHFQ